MVGKGRLQSLRVHEADAIFSQQEGERLCERVSYTGPVNQRHLGHWTGTAFEAISTAQKEDEEMR